MAFIAVFIIIAVCYIYAAWLSGRYETELRTNMITKPLGKLILLSPLIGVVAFAVLFMTVLKGRVWERWTHALLVFALWMFATQFYNNILSHYKKKGIFVSSVCGMVLSAASAVILTPLDRYVDMIYVHMDVFSAILGGVLFLIFYLGHVVFKKNNN